MFIDPDEIEKVINEDTDDIINLADVFTKIYDACSSSNTILMGKEAYEEFKTYQREVTQFRKDDLYEEARVSIKSKSVGIMVRLAGICCLLREAIQKEEPSELVMEILKEDIVRAITIVKYSNAISFYLLDEKAKIAKSLKRSLPEADDLTLDFLIPFNKKVKTLVTADFTTCAEINRNNLYPIINNQRSNDVGQKFVNGLVELGFGKLETRNGKSGFVPYHPDKQDCPNPEQLKSYWEKLNIKSTQ